MTGELRPPARGSWVGEPRATPAKASRDKGAFAIPFDRTTVDPRAGILAKGAGGIGGVISPLQASLDPLAHPPAPSAPPPPTHSHSTHPPLPRLPREPPPPLN